VTTSSAVAPLRAVREGNAAKRAAILAAARELFVLDGVERTSMDAIAARAGVSKRTVYDYYGDKRRLLIEVIVAAGESLLETLRTAVADHLSDDADIPDLASLEAALTRFAVQVGESMLTTSDYAATFRLIAENGAALEELADHPLAQAPEEAVAERLAHFARRGLLDVPDPRLAADHFNALTTLLATNGRYPARVDDGEIRTVLTEGVRAFVRAYAHRG